MTGILVDSNVILDIFVNDPIWATWSTNTLNQYSSTDTLYINSIIYTEISISFKRIEELENAIQTGGFELLEIPKEALFLAGKAFLNYRKNEGQKSSPLPDFYIGAQASVMGLPLITRDVGRYRTYFPQVNLNSP